MKRIHLKGSAQVDVIEVEKPVPGPGQVLIRTQMSALCGSEMHGYRDKGVPGGNNGHEAAGIVEQLGEGVTTLQVGMRVGASAIAGCGECDECKAGRYTWCLKKFSFFGNMHSEYFVLPAMACHVLPDAVPWDVAVLITGDGLGVPFHSSTKINQPGAISVAVFGLGPIGLGTILLQAHLGRRVIGIDLSEKRRELALQMGAWKTIDAGAVKDVPAEVRALTMGRGADVCVEAAGIPITAKQCFAAARTHGLVILNGEQPKVEISPSDDLIRRDIRAVGSWFYHYAEYRDMLALYEQGLKVEKMVTHRFPMQQAAQAYEVMAKGLSGKVMLVY